MDDEKRVLTGLSAEPIRGTRPWAPRQCNCYRAIGREGETGYETATLPTTLYGCWPSPCRSKDIYIDIITTGTTFYTR